MSGSVRTASSTSGVAAWFAVAKNKVLVSAATPLVDEAVRTDPDIYPLADVRERLYADRSMNLKDMRLRTRLWTTFRSRQ